MPENGDTVTINGDTYFVGQEHSSSRKGDNGIVRYYIPMTHDLHEDKTKKVITMSDKEYNKKIEWPINKEKLNTITKSASIIASRLENDSNIPVQSQIASHKVLRNGDLMGEIKSFLNGGRKTKRKYKRRHRKTKRALSKK
jgi:hypothetical protein